MSNNQLQANPELVIKYLTDQNTKLTRENAMLKAIIEELSQQQQDTQQDENQHLSEVSE